MLQETKIEFIFTQKANNYAIIYLIVKWLIVHKNFIVSLKILSLCDYLFDPKYIIRFISVKSPFFKVAERISSKGFN